jgi:hypothetical protein
MVLGKEPLEDRSLDRVRDHAFALVANTQADHDRGVGVKKRTPEFQDRLGLVLRSYRENRQNGRYGGENK